MLVLLCMVFAQNAAMGFNRYVSRKIETNNEKTSNIRETPIDKISVGPVLAFVMINCAFFILCTYFINDICFYLSPFALLIILGYSYIKRFSALCHFILGLGLSLAPIGAYLAVVGSFAWLPIYYSFAVFFWASGLDILYSIQGFEFDKEQKLKSIAVFLGKKGSIRLSRILYFFSALFVVLAGLHAGFGWMYWIGVIIFCLLLIYQHSIVPSKDLSRRNVAFSTINGFASVIFAVFIIVELLLSDVI